MKNIKKSVATLGLLGIIIMTASSANATTGIIVVDGITSNGPSVTQRILNAVRNTVIGQFTGVTLQDREGIMFSDQSTTGIMFSD